MRGRTLPRFVFLLCALGAAADEIRFPDGTVVDVYPGATVENGVIVSAELKAPAVLSTTLGKVTFHHVIGFHPGGKIKQGQVAEPVLVTTPAGKLRVGPSASGAHEGYLSFLPSGRVNSCPLAEPQTVATPAGSLLVDIVVFGEDGRIGKVWLAGTQEVACPMGKVPMFASVDFHQGGRIRTCYLDGPVEVKTPVGRLRLTGSYEHAGGYTEFNENGTLARVYLGALADGGQKVKTSIGDLELTEFLRFHDNGTIRYGLAARPYTMTLGAQKIRMGAEDRVLAHFYNRVYFYPSGVFKAGTIVDPQDIGGVRFEKALIGFAESGRFLGSSDIRTLEPETVE